MIHVTESEKLRIVGSFTNETPRDIASVIEELAELTQVLTKYLRQYQIVGFDKTPKYDTMFHKWKRRLVEEFGDVLVVLTWLQWEFGVADEDLHERIETVIDRYGG